MGNINKLILKIVHATFLMTSMLLKIDKKSDKNIGIYYI